MSAIANTADAKLVELAADHMLLPLPAGVMRFHYIWLRDNCWCAECRVVQSGERRLYTADIPRDIAPSAADLDDSGTLHITWNDGHQSRYLADWLTRHAYSGSAPAAGARPQLWTAAIGSLPWFEHDEVVGTTVGQLAYLEAVRDYGAAVVRHTPSVVGEVERFAQSIGHVRETAFERVHNVRHDPTGYNVAHTPLELKPHTDLPSYHWPPSIQLLHFLVNEATGGESTLTDGWAILADLRDQDPDAFDTLCQIPVTFQLFSDDEDTCATAPMVQLDRAGEVATFRYSNQLALPINAPFEDVTRFYDAYQKLGSMVDSAEYKLAFRTNSGDLLTVHSHRVLHGRLAFDPASGARHLQDVYMEYDDLMARRRVLLGSHKPTSAAGDRP